MHCVSTALTPADIVQIEIDMESYIQSLRQALALKGKPSSLRELGSCVYHAGVFKPEPGIDHVVYFVACQCDNDYKAVIEKLRKHNKDKPFAVLIPTDMRIEGETVRQMGLMGILILALSEVLYLGAQGKFAARQDPILLFRDVGKGHVAAKKTEAPIHARALTHMGWRDLTKVDYEGLLAALDKFDVFVDARTRRVVNRIGDKGKSTSRPTMKKLFPYEINMLRLAVEKRHNFDPTVDNDDRHGKSGLQIFQHMRKKTEGKVSTKDGREDWALFKTDKGEQGNAIYHFQPESNVQFALIFYPEDDG